MAQKKGPYDLLLLEKTQGRASMSTVWRRRILLPIRLFREFSILRAV